MPKEYRRHMAKERMEAMGLARPLPAISGAEPWIGSYSADGRPLGFLSPSDADGSMPMEPVNCAASSDSTSPNRLSVTSTSNCLGLRTNCMAALSARIWCSSTSA